MKKETKEKLYLAWMMFVGFGILGFYVYIIVFGK